MITILKKNIVWRLRNPLSIIATLFQPFMWLLLYGSIAQNNVAGLGNNYIDFILPGIIFLLIMFASSSGGFINFITKRNFKRILISPLNRRSIILGHTLETVILSLFEIIILFLLSILLKTNIQITFIRLFIALFLILEMSFLTSLIFYYLSLKLKNEAVYETIISLISFPLFLLSGSLFPIAKEKGLILLVTLINPAYYFISSLRETLYGNSFNLAITIILLLAIVIIPVFILTIRKLNKIYE